MSNDKETCKGQPTTREERIAQTQQWLGATHVPRVGEPVVKQEVMNDPRLLLDGFKPDGVL